MTRPRDGKGETKKPAKDRSRVSYFAEGATELLRGVPAGPAGLARLLTFAVHEPLRRQQVALEEPDGRQRTETADEGDGHGRGTGQLQQLMMQSTQSFHGSTSGARWR